MANNILQELSKDNILSVIPLAEKFFETKTGSNCNTLNILIAVQALTFKKCLFSGENGPDLVQGVFKLSKMCCGNLSDRWNCDLFKCINCIYNIVNFLLNQRFAPQAKELASILQDLKSKRSKDLSSREKDMIKNITSVFTAYIEKLIVKNRTFCRQEKIQMITWWKFIFSLSELNDFYSMKSFFHLSSALLSKPGLIDTNGDLWNLFFEKCEKWLKICKMKQENIQFSSYEFSLVLYTFDAYLSTCKLPEIKTLNFSHTINILQTLSLALKMRDAQLFAQITLFISAMKACESFQKMDSLSDFKFIPQHLKRNTNWCVEVIKFVSNFLFNFSNLISNEPQFKNRTDIKLLIDSILATFNCSLNSTLNSNCIDNIIIHVRFIRAALILINSSSAETVKLLYGRIRLLFEGLFQIPLIGEVGGKYFYRGVTDCIVTIHTLCKSSSYSNSYDLCCAFLQKIVKTKLPEPIPNCFSQDMHCLLSYLVTSAAELSCKFNALVYLLALTNQETIFKVDIFKYWCKLKLIPGGKNQVETVTVYDLIACDENVTFLDQTCTDLLQWPNSVVKMLDFENLLLQEIQCYSKHKELFKTASLAVYKVAAKRVSNKLILARIICCAVDVLSIDCETIYDISNFVLSLNNLIKSFSEKNSSDYQLVKGDLYYQLARCELFNLRKAASLASQTVLLENQEDIPIVGEEATCCNIFSSLSFLEVKKLLPVLGYMEDAFNWWKKGFTGIANYVLTEEIALSSITFMKAMAYLYRLLGYQEKEILVWEFLYSQARNLKNEKYQIIAVAELCILKQTVNQEWITAVENILETESSHTNSYFYYLYKINRAKNFYLNKKFQPCYEVFSTLTEDKFTHLRLIHAQYIQLEYMLSVCSEKREQLVAMKLPGSLEKAWEIAFISVNKAVTFSDKCASQSIYLDLTLELAQGYCDSLDVIKCRSFSRWTLKESLKLFLALRSCRLMCALADGDRLCCDFEQMERKLKCLETVLGVCQVEEECLPSRSSSTSLSYKYPLLEHPATCSCPTCSHLEFSFLTLDSTRLRASYYSLTQKWTESKICFKNGFDVLSKIKKRIRKENLNFFIENELRFYVAATESLVLWNKTEKALTYSEYAFKLQNYLLIPKKHLSSIVWMKKKYNCQKKDVGMISSAISYAPDFQKKAEFQQGQASTPVNGVNAVVPVDAPKKDKFQGVSSLDMSPHPFVEAHKKLFKSEIKEKKSDTVCCLETGGNQLTLKGGLALNVENHSETTPSQKEAQNENNINASNLTNVDHQLSKSNYLVVEKIPSKTNQRQNVEFFSNKMTSSNIKTSNKTTPSPIPEIIVTHCDNENFKICSSKQIKECKTPIKSSSKSAFSVFCDEAKGKNPRRKINGKKKLLFSTEEDKHEIKVTDLSSDFNVDIVSNLDVSDVSVIDTSVNIENNSRLIESPFQSQGSLVVQKTNRKGDWRVNKNEAFKTYSRSPKHEADADLDRRIAGLCLIDLEDDNKPRRKNLRRKQATGDAQMASDVCIVPSMSARKNLNPPEMLTSTPRVTGSTVKNNLSTPTSTPTVRPVRSCRKRRL